MKALRDKVERRIRGGVSELISPQINPHWENRQRRLLRNWQRLAGVVSTLVSTENGVWNHPAVRAVKVRTEMPVRRAGAGEFVPAEKGGARKMAVAVAGCSHKKERAGFRAVSLLDLSDVREESCRFRDLADLARHAVTPRAAIDEIRLHGGYTEPRKQKAQSQ
ncbi:hypothetical protein KTF37_18340 [Burkholderia multivorans]|uniref:hypothetical protein n=1 Tax=Burkholderia multivorans TaxID=87883 RepID=UPI001C24CB24|nr:hypothetical protein [Burkholderia multivorans]MBU9678815.1 hypothetical protein [Burkholderia multivorans]